jgi:hypothetical protein
VQPALQAEERDDAWREGLRAQRAMLAMLQCDDVISEAIYEELVTEVDAALDDTASLKEMSSASIPIPVGNRATCNRRWTS